MPLVYYGLLCSLVWDWILFGTANEKPLAPWQPNYPTLAVTKTITSNFHLTMCYIVIQKPITKGHFTMDPLLQADWMLKPLRCWLLRYRTGVQEFESSGT